MPETHLLFVEDEELIRLIVTESLVEAGFRVTEASSGEAAMSLLRAPANFDLLLADVHLPGRFNGIDVAHRARARVADLPIVFLTGRPDMLRARWTLGDRDLTIPKPYRTSEVLAAVRRCLAQQDEQ
jgi:DNA-binding response OmpR family regulator